jgi:hypothetical protein
MLTRIVTRCAASEGLRVYSDTWTHVVWLVLVVPFPS